MSSNYKIEIDDFARKTLKKMDKQASVRITKWLSERISGCNNPRLWGSALTGDLGEFWRYRIGNYRVLCKIEDAKLVVLVVEIDHRKNI